VEEAVFVGDSLKKDVEGSAGIGITSVWYYSGNEESQYLQAKNYKEMQTIFDSNK
jgi:FMN phosphatase YigB (HAD superfamily)